MLSLGVGGGVDLRGTTFYLRSQDNKQVGTIKIECSLTHFFQKPIIYSFV